MDVVRASTRLPATGLAGGGPVAFNGYSQGGGGAAWAGELAPSYAPELNVVGITAGGTPADLNAVAQFLDGSIGFGFLLLASLGLDAAYPELNLPAYLNERGQTLYKTQQGACIDAVFGYAFQRIADYTTSNPLATPAWQARLGENKLGSTPPRAPVYLFHGTHDEIIPLAQAQTLRKQYCAAGVKVRWATFVGESAPDAVQEHLMSVTGAHPTAFAAPQIAQWVQMLPVKAPNALDTVRADVGTTDGARLDRLVRDAAAG